VEVNDGVSLIEVKKPDYRFDGNRLNLIA